MEKTKETIVGKVISTGMDKTIVVLTETYKNHPLYKKELNTLKNIKHMMKKTKQK